MPYNGSGGFTRLMNWSNDALAGIKIKADRHDQEDDNFASGLTNAITRDGQTQPTADIPLNGKRIINLGTPTVDTDAATKAYADLPKPFTTGATISGADANGRLNFTSPTGVNGLTFTGADLSWLAKIAGNPAGYANRLVLNDKVNGTGNDLVAFTDQGYFAFTTSGNILANMYHDGTNWRAIGAGYANLFQSLNNGTYIWYTTTASVAAGAVAPLVQSMGLTAAGGLTVRATITAGGRVSGTDVLSQSNVYANNGSTYLNTDGNVVGTVWSNWGASDAYAAISARIEARATAWANDRVSNLQYRKVSEGSTALPGAGTTRAPAGAVLTGLATSSGYTTTFLYMYLQAYDPVRGWVGFSG